MSTWRPSTDEEDKQQLDARQRIPNRRVILRQLSNPSPYRPDQPPDESKPDESKPDEDWIWVAYIMGTIGSVYAILWGFEVLPWFYYSPVILGLGIAGVIGVVIDMCKQK